MSPKSPRIDAATAHKLQSACNALTFAAFFCLLLSLSLMTRGAAGLFGLIGSIFFFIGIGRVRTIVTTLSEAEESQMSSEAHASERTPSQEEEMPVTSKKNPYAITNTPVSEKEAVIALKNKTPHSSIQPKKKKEEKVSWATNVNWEEWVGQKLLQKVGIVIVLIGMLVMLKYSFDNKWIDELGRLILAAFAGVLLLGAGEFFRTKYAKWSDGFTGGGLTLLMFTVWAGRTLYAPVLLGKYGIGITPSMAMGLYIAITVVGCLASIRYRSPIIAWLALIGGYVTPLLIESPAPNYVGLTIYLAILTAGLFSFAWYTRWRTIRLASFILTQLYLLGAIFPSGEPNGITDTQQLVIAIGFYILFSVMPAISYIRMKDEATSDDVALVCLSGLAVFFPVLDALGGWQSEWTTVLCLGLAASHILFGAITVSQRSQKDDNLTNTYLSASIGLIALALYRQMGLEWFALGFAPYALLLVHLGTSIRRSVPIRIGFIIMGLAIAGLVANIPILQSRHEVVWHPFFSTWSITSAVVIASLVGFLASLRRLPEEFRLYSAQFSHGASLAIGLIAFLTVTFEVTHLVFTPNLSLSFAYLIFTAGCIGLFLLTAEIVWFILAFLVQILVIFFTFFGSQSVLSVPSAIYSTKYVSLVPFLHPWTIVALVSIGLLALLFVVSGKMKQKNVGGMSIKALIGGIVLAQIWIHGTVEIENLATIYSWSSSIHERILSAWWIAFALALVGARKFPVIARVGVGLLLIPLIKDVAIMMQGTGGLYETILWTVLPIILATTGARIKNSDMLYGGVLFLAITAGVDMFTHLGLYQASLLRSIWWAIAGLATLVAGFTEREAILRKAAMCIFAGAVVKLLVFDFNALATPVRIAASIATGLLMIGASFLYQRYSSRLQK